jgi:peptide/nickel transport system ATP-binding protein
MNPVLEIVDLQVSYYTDAGRARALDGVNLILNAGEKLGLVGESGSGKSTMALAMMRMIKPPGRIEGGQVSVGGTNLTALSEEEMLKARLSRIAYIPQGAMNSLNPVLRIGRQMMDAIKAHDREAGKAEMQERCIEALASVDLKPEVFRMYAHELSGGMKQRVCIAIGILLKPQVLIADEPTSALDVVTQRQVMETIDRVQDQIGAAVILIGHDMGLMAQFVDKVAVMYAGRLMEVSSVRDMFTDPKHPYAQALINSLPSLENKGVFQGIPGLAPALLRLPSGCTFHPRCPHVMEICRTVRPDLQRLSSGQEVSCHLYTTSTAVESDAMLLEPADGAKRRA